MKEVNIIDLIGVLQGLREKGIETVQIEGTLMSKEDGNTIIVSTEKQM